ncbi:MAG: hypothetical protein CRN43_08465 [Candidatus Nephrothrix sp. EaCA]|nr:MAG: hypothetical protein CRN43_08465 [Candidatus Nephrothrix sp. EaCA]
MRDLINIYCDESCHLENDGQNIMALGAVFCPTSKKAEIFNRLHELKLKHNLIPAHFKAPKQNRARYEIKWNKVSKSKLDFYKDVIDFFFDNADLGFRVLVVPNKSELDYKGYGHTHDSFYCKMYFNLLEVILNPEYGHHIYIDIKDTRSREKAHKLEEILRNDKYDYSKETVKKVQPVRSHEVELAQVADLLTGAVSYVHRGLNTSKPKTELIEHIRRRSKYSNFALTVAPANICWFGKTKEKTIREF